MTAQYKITITRPSLDDVFWIEPIYSIDPPVKWADGTMPPALEAMKFTTPIVPMLFPAWLPEYYTDHQMANKTGFTSFVIEGLLTWTQIIARKNELRPDLLDLVENEALFGNWLPHDGHANYKPPFNPFSTTWVAISTWDSLANLQSGVASALDELNLVSTWNTALATTNNILVEEVKVDDTVQSGIKFFS
jgi:hypothetical protein